MGVGVGVGVGVVLGGIFQIKKMSEFSTMEKQGYSKSKNVGLFHNGKAGIFHIKKMSDFSTMGKQGFSKLEYSVNIVVVVGVGVGVGVVLGGIFQINKCRTFPTWKNMVFPNWNIP